GSGECEHVYRSARRDIGQRPRADCHDPTVAVARRTGEHDRRELREPTGPRPVSPRPHLRELHPAMIEKIGRYRILERIGRGGMGIVYKAHDPILDRLGALKVISSEAEVTDELKTRFYREAQACARLNHQNIVVVHDLGEDQGRLFIAMEFLDGEELKLLISQRRQVPLADKLALMSQVCD